MEVVALSPLRTGSVLWRPRADRWTLTVVCKATYALAPGESPLAADQDPVNTRDTFWDDDPQRSIYAPSDLVPFKPRVDVMLVGHAYAPRSETVRSLVARLIVGSMEKAVEVFCPRVLGREGDLREGPRWNKMPIRYEHAAGGTDTWNPVGIGPSTPPDGYGQRPLPNLQPAGLRVTQWSDIFVPVGLGPIAPAWALRREKLGRRAEGWSDDAWPQIPLDDDFDGAFFQSAPADQQLDALQDDERIVLEYLNADHPSIATKLAGARPHALVEIPGAPRRDLVMTADTLWIDTDRARCTVTWRGQVAVDGPEQQGRVLVAMRESDPMDSTIIPPPDSTRPVPRRTIQTLPFVPAGDSTQASRGMDSTRRNRAVELVWFSPSLRVREVARWTPILPEPPAGTHPSAEADVARVLARAVEAPSDLERVLFEAAGEAGELSPATLCFEGTLAFPFDEIEALRARIDAAAPLARMDAMLSDRLDFAREMAKTDLRGTPDVAEGLCASIREAWSWVNRMLPAEHLDVQADRSLLAKRAYQRRRLLGKTWIRALFTPLAGGAPAPAYVASAAAPRLPLFARFTARIVADVLPRQDQHEPSPVSLRVAAIGRVIDREHT